MNFKDLMVERLSILQGIERDLALFKRMEEEHYERIFGIIADQAKIMNQTVERTVAFETHQLAKRKIKIN